MVTMNKGNKGHINFKLVIHSARTGFKTGGAKVQVTGHCFTNTESILNIHKS